MKKQAGFGAVGVVLIVVAVALIGLIAWRVYDASKSKSTSSTNQGSSSTGSSQTNNQTQPVDPYAGWKTYCDDVEKACFKYPADWVVSSHNQSGLVNVSIKNPAASLAAVYTNPDTRDGADMPYYTVMLEDLTTPIAAYKVVGGFTVSSTANEIPAYKVVDKSLTGGLAAGQQGSLVDTARFTFGDSSHSTGRLEVYPITGSVFDATAAKAWFTSSDAEIALLVVKSFYLE